MTFREYWRVLGFGALSLKTRQLYQDGFNAKLMMDGVVDKQRGQLSVALAEATKLTDLLSVALANLRDERQSRIELHEKLTDSLMTKAGLQKLNFKPGPPKESKLQALTALDEMEADYDRVQAEDRELSQ